MFQAPNLRKKPSKLPDLLLKNAIFNTLHYAGVFNCTLTRRDVWLRLQTSIRYPYSAVSSQLDELVRQHKVHFTDKRYCISRNKSTHVKSVVNMIGDITRKTRFLTWIPFIEAVCVTGSVAAGNLGTRDDVDLLIITSPRRLWLVRLMVVIVSELTGTRRRPHDTDTRDKLCFNMFLDSSAQGLLVRKHNLYTAHELLQSVCIHQKHTTYKKFISQNSWAKQYLANWYKVKLEQAEDMTVVRSGKINGKRLQSSVLDMLNTRAFKIQLFYMKGKLTSEEVRPDQALFHPGLTDKTVLQAFELSKKSIS